MATQAGSGTYIELENLIRHREGGVMKRLPMPFPLFPLALAALLISSSGCGLLNPEQESELFTREDTKTVGVRSYPVLTVENFVGDVNIDFDVSETIVVKSVRWAKNEAYLDRITVETTGTDSGYSVRTSNPDDLDGVGVDLDITTPRLSRVYLRLGVGDAIVNNPGRERTDINVGVGNIDSHTMFGGVYLLESGIGGISLVIPSFGLVYAEIALATGIGLIDLGHIKVGGEVTEKSVNGSIGSPGGDGNGEIDIQAKVGVGNIHLRWSFMAAS
jgi:hypothetical protein